MWIQTYSGKALDLLDPKPEQIVLRDIAHHLSLLPRFTGATEIAYSVAQHSSLVCQIVVVTLGRPDLAGEALFHDAGEYAVNDVSRPMKRAMRAIMREWGADDGGERSPFDEIESRVQAAIWRRFGLSMDHDAASVVHSADAIALETERRDLLGPPPRPWTPTGEEPLPARIIAMTAIDAERRFLELARDYGVTEVEL